jgi:signal peptidase II
MPDSGGFSSRPALCGYGTAMMILILDQLTKHWASATLVYRDPVAVTSWFDLMFSGCRRLAALVFYGGYRRDQRRFGGLVVSIISVSVMARPGSGAHFGGWLG